MLLGTKYKVETDPRNLILYHKSISKKKGSENWKVVGYFYDFRELLKFVADNEIKLVGLNDLEAIAEKQDEIYKLIQSLQSMTPKDIGKRKAASS